MRSIRLGSALLLAVGILAAAACGGDDGESAADTDTTTTETTTEPSDPGNTLIGSVGPGFEISVTTATRQAPGTLQSGTYQLDVDDKSSAHNFHLTGDGVDVSTDVGGTGAESFQVELAAGTYTFVCDPHSSTMNGTLEVAD